jgi:molecular chaperone DnaK (HSP70)
MKTFIGIDLGTTNSAICSYDGSETRKIKGTKIKQDKGDGSIY